MPVTAYQERIYALLNQIPRGRITTYKALSDALESSPRAVGGALRNNPFAPEVPCHRCIASTGYIGGFQGDWRDAPSGQNCEKKLKLLKSEGVEFDEKGMLLDVRRLWADFKSLIQKGVKTGKKNFPEIWICNGIKLLILKALPSMDL